MKLKNYYKIFFIIFLIMVFSAFNAEARNRARIKDVVAVQGIRDNILIGYGLVVGLNGTGDNLTNSIFTQKGLEEFLSKLGINTRGSTLKTKNVAAVTVTATLPPFARHGSKIDVHVSTLGDAKDLKGGMLLATPLLGADGQVYAVAQGSVATGGITVSGASQTINKGVPTTGTITSGAIIEKEIDFALNTLSELNLALNNSDITTAQNIASEINVAMGEKIANAIDSGTIKVQVPPIYINDVAGLLSAIEQLEIDTDNIAKIIIDESTGTVVMGENVRLDTVAIAQGNLTIRIDDTTSVSQPNSFAPASANTITTNNTDIFLMNENIKVNELNGLKQEATDKLTVVSKNTTLGELVTGLNSLGVNPRDLITILQMIKASGALQANIEVR